MVFLAGRAAAPGHVRPQARRAGRDPRRVQARSPPTSPASRSASYLPRLAGDDGQVRRHPLARRRRGRARRLPVHDRLLRQQSASRRGAGRASARSSRSCRGRSIRRSRRSSASRPRWGTRPGPTPATRASSASPHAPFTPNGDGPGAAWRLSDGSASTASTTARRCSAQLRPPPPRRRRQRRDRRAWTPSRSGAFDILTLEQAGRGARRDAGRPAAAGQVRQRRHEERRRRRPLLQRPVPDGPPAGRGRRPRA